MIDSRKNGIGPRLEHNVNAFVFLVPCCLFVVIVGCEKMKEREGQKKDHLGVPVCPRRRKIIDTLTVVSLSTN